MTQEQLAVREWMVLFGQEVLHHPSIPNNKVCSLRVSLIQEELDELRLALLKDENIVAAADALGDLLYVVLGSAVALGIDLEPVFKEIHYSNLSKFHIDEHGRRYAKHTAMGKVIKPATYVPPDLRKVIEKQLPTAKPNEPHNPSDK